MKHDYQFTYSDKWRCCTKCGRVENKETKVEPSCTGKLPKLQPRSLAEVLGVRACGTTSYRNQGALRFNPK